MMDVKVIIGMVRRGETPPHNWTRGLTKSQIRKVFFEKYTMCLEIARSGGKPPRSWHKGLTKEEISLINLELDKIRSAKNELIERRRMVEDRNRKYRSLWKRVATGGGLITANYGMHNEKGSEKWSKWLSNEQISSLKDFFIRKHRGWFNEAYHLALDKKLHHRACVEAATIIKNGISVVASGFKPICCFTSLNTIEYFADCFGMNTTRAIVFLARYGFYEERGDKFFENLSLGLVDGLTCRKLHDRSLQKIISSMDDHYERNRRMKFARHINSSGRSSDHCRSQLRSLGFVA